MLADFFSAENRALYCSYEKEYYTPLLNYYLKKKVLWPCLYKVTWLA